MNETLQTIAKRYSCRAYDSGRALEREKIEAIAMAALQSPSGMNRQPWQIAVVTDKALIQEMDAEGMRIFAQAENQSTYERLMSRGGTLFYGAPCMFLILQQPGSGMDTGIVSQNIALAAASLGLGSVICGLAAVPFTGPKGDELKRRIGFPDGYEFGVAVLVGYAQKEGEPHAPDLSKVQYVGNA